MRENIIIIYNYVSNSLYEYSSGGGALLANSYVYRNISAVIYISTLTSVELYFRFYGSYAANTLQINVETKKRTKFYAVRIA